MNKKQVNEMVQQLRSYAETGAVNTYETCQILTAFRDQKLFELLGYETFQEFVTESDIGMGYGVASKHCTFFTHANNLGYKRAEVIEVVREFGLMHALRLLRMAQKKVALSTLQRWSAEYYAEHRTMTFTLDEKQESELEAVLMEYGMEVTEAGYRSHATEALLAMAGIKQKKKVA